MKQVYEFKEGGKEMIPILGGKGGNLSEMVKIGLPIPYGIIVSTTACNQFFKDGKELSESLKEEILKNIQILESTTGKKIQSDNPLLVSVRSGAPISMPGMMDTILNVGFNDDVAQKMLFYFNISKYTSLIFFFCFLHNVNVLRSVYGYIFHFYGKVI